LSGTDLIDLLIERWLSFGNQITVDNAAWRALCLHFIQKRVTRMWLLHDWGWTYSEYDTVVRSAAGSTPEPRSAGEIEPFPPDYHSMTRSGIILPLTHSLPPLIWKDKLEYLRFARRGTDNVRRKNPEFYTEIFSLYDTNGNFIPDRRIMTWPIPLTDFAVRLSYKVKPPLVADMDDSDDDHQSNLSGIPEEYHDTILVDGPISDLMDKQGDGRSAVYEGKYLKGIEEAWEDENQGQNQGRKWGQRYGSRSRRRGLAIY
jgi:hypothetical protein